MSTKTKTVIIGGATGIGKALAGLLVKKGELVVIGGRSPEHWESTVKELGANASGHSVDITHPSELSTFFETIGSCDHLVITATQTLFKPFCELTESQVLVMVNTKLLGSFFAAQAALKHLKPKGSILFFGGFIGYKAMKNASVVALVNTGLEGLTKTLALELAPLRVNLISPGMVDTGKWDSLSTEEKQKAKVAAGLAYPVQRVGESYDLASVALMALENTFITGSVITVDGGGHL